MHKTSKAFPVNLSTILDEFQLATQWGQASIILTVHKSTFSQEKTKKALRKKLRGLGYRIIDIDIIKAKGNFIEYMLQQKNIENIIFYVSNVEWGGGKDEKDGYRLLNLHRETLIEQKIKVVFLLTMREASNLPNYAPDFWAFRHRVLEFGNPRAHNLKQPPVRLMLWHIENSITPIIDIKNKISSLAKMLSEIPDQDEAVSLRVDLLYELGFLCWYSGDHLSAEKSLMGGFELAKKYALIESLVKFQNGLSIICYERENYQSAIDLLQNLIKENPRDCLLPLNQAVVLFAMKKRYNAIAKGKKATSLCTQNPWAWNSLGFLHYFAGHMDDGINCFQKAIDLSPKIGYFYEGLAICYMAIGLVEKANAQLDQAKNNSGDREIFREVLKEYIDGNKEKAELLIKAGIDSGKLRELDVTREPTLNALVASI